MREKERERPTFNHNMNKAKKVLSTSYTLEILAALKFGV